jgi:transcriptional regulator with XRE-family HTH domain
LNYSLDNDSCLAKLRCMENFGDKLTALRKEANLSQAQVAEKVGISQTTISRLESTKVYSGDVAVVAKLARLFKVPLKELLPYLQAGVIGDTFFAVCPNPDCEDNSEFPNQVTWASFREYPSSDFSEINFCPTCGTALCKECPSCQRRFDKKFTLFCVRCGARVIDNPTGQGKSGVVDNPQNSKRTENEIESDIPF